PWQERSRRVWNNMVDCQDHRKSRAMHHYQKPAFTLIELLVVIAIIAIIAAILFPVFARAREAARKAACLSNEKQIAAAVQMYMQDYDETFPFVLNVSANFLP